ncbi:hypothetical protein [Acinetobacter bereziniae]|uniref:hypothetical protein n=1 Tax=Acinetobacter bereziniae TaxID=106648 RepID=UPI0025753001|nr:hypothetical protein [Acinetobacter bereziniae]MDM1783094.1 hypothetical protein [Acinetobacter bereziniae]
MKLYNLKRKYIKYFLIFYIFALIIFASTGDLKFKIFGSFIAFLACLVVIIWMYKDEKNKGILTEKIFEILKFEHSEDVDLDKFTYKDKDGFTVSWVYHYQHAFKKNNPYPKDYFEKK